MRQSISAADDRRREALGRLVDQQQPARLDDRAGDRQHLLLAARQRAGARQPELLQRRKEAENPVQPRVVERPLARAEHQVFPTVRSENTAIVSGT